MVPLPVPLLLALLPSLILAHRIPLTFHSPSSSSSASAWAQTVAAAEALEGKYAHLYADEHDFTIARRERRELSGDGEEGGWGDWGVRQGLGLGEHGLGKRADGTRVGLTNVYGDATYIAAIQMGNSPSTQSVNVILDTGSADLWLSSATCAGCTGDGYTYDTTKSSSVQVSTTPFSILYGSGSASGTLATDTVTLGPFSVSQTFGLATSTTSNLIFSPLTGIMGLGFQAIAVSKAVPFWLDLVSGSKLTEPLMAFYLTRHFGTSSALNEGGECTLGYTDSSLYEGDIHYVDMPSGSRTYWLIPFDAAIVDGTLVTLAANTNAAIDTGTTLIIGPSADVKAIHSQIDGSRDVGGGHYVFPCDSKVSVSFVFGGQPWALSSADMSRGLYQSGSSECISAISASDLGSKSPMSWIVGAAFLKNVYAVFRSSPPSIGFALLSSSAGGSPSAPSLPSPSTSPSSSSALATSSSSSSSPSSSTTTSTSLVTSSALTMSTRISSASSASSASASASASTSSEAGGVGGIFTGILPGAQGQETTTAASAEATGAPVTGGAGASRAATGVAVVCGLAGLVGAVLVI